MNTLIVQFVLGALCILFLASCSLEYDEPRSLTILHINDVYRINGMENGNIGGIARIRTLRKELEQQDSQVLVLHGGDMFFPSLLSRVFEGEQMIDVLNLLDGTEKQFDQRMFAVFGNHEFDKNRIEDAQLVDQLVEDSEFNWLASNISFSSGETTEHTVSSPNILTSKLLDVNGIKVGLFGLTTDLKQPEYAVIDSNYVEIAQRMSRELREQGAELVIALTHLFMPQDVEILELGDLGPDVIFGGHDHAKQFREVGGRYAIKADADARTASVAKIEIDHNTEVHVELRFEELDQSVAKDPQVQTRTDEWLKRHDQTHCRQLNRSEDCLNQSLAKTRVTLMAEEQEIRRYETNLGNWIADQALDRFRKQGAQIAFVNSGGLRLNQNIPAETHITGRHLEELFPYPNELVLIRLTGKELQQVVDHAISGWEADEGRWLQIAGFAFTHDSNNRTTEKLSLLTSKGPRLVQPDEEIIAAVNGFLVNPKFGQDGFTFLSERHVIPYSGELVNLKDLVRERLKKSQEVWPEIEGRICNASRPGPCLLM